MIPRKEKTNYQKQKPKYYLKQIQLLYSTSPLFLLILFQALLWCMVMPGNGVSLSLSNFPQPSRLAWSSMPSFLFLPGPLGANRARAACVFFFGCSPTHPGGGG